MQAVVWLLVEIGIQDKEEIIERIMEVGQEYHEARNIQ